jgi:dCTP diphosphatase
MTLSTFEAVRRYSSNFVAERQWNQFHTPTNLVMALSGECGELAEIFQWKGPISKDQIATVLTEKEIVHIGEEVSDVLIYSVRLCEVCGIDLASAIENSMSIRKPSERSEFDGSWTDLSFQDVNTLIRIESTHNVRLDVLKIQASAGKLCNLFAVNADDSIEYHPAASHESNSESMGSFVAEISLTLMSICKFFDLDIGKCVCDKFKKNEAKYPANLVKGSSAKYTEYVDQIRNSDASVNES